MFAYRSILQELPRPAAVRESPRAPWLVASAACGLAPSLGALVALRLAQAVGAAMLQANSVALVTTSAPQERMRFALGVQAGAQSIGLALGPTLGGLLTATVGWRAVYAVVSAAAAAIALAGRAQAGGQAGRPREADPSGGFS
jgi:MFS family permease